MNEYDDYIAALTEAERALFEQVKAEFPDLDGTRLLEVFFTRAQAAAAGGEPA